MEPDRLSPKFIAQNGEQIFLNQTTLYSITSYGLKHLHSMSCNKQIVPKQITCIMHLGGQCHGSKLCFI